jgi:hypothetical protein
MQLSSQWLRCMELHCSKFPASKQVFQKRTQLEYESENGKSVIILGTRWNIWEWSCHVMRIKICIVTEQNQAVLNSLTAKSVPAGTKNIRPVGFYSRNSTESTLHHKHNNPQTLPPWWCRSPLIRCGIYGPARSDARNLFWRGRTGGWLKQII